MRTRTKMSAMSADAAWFRAHPETNYRHRTPEAGEVAEVGGFVLPSGKPWDDIPPPAPGFLWSILAIALPGGATARMLSYSDPAAQNIVIPTVLTDRIAIV